MKLYYFLLVATSFFLLSCIDTIDPIPIPDIKAPIETAPFNPYFKVIGIVQMNEALQPVIKETSYEPIGERLGVRIYMDSIIYFHGAIDFSEGLLVSDCREDTIYNYAVTDTSLVYEETSLAFWECLAASSCDPLDELFYFEIIAR